MFSQPVEAEASKIALRTEEAEVSAGSLDYRLGGKIGPCQILAAVVV